MKGAASYDTALKAAQHYVDTGVLPGWAKEALTQFMLYRASGWLDISSAPVGEFHARGWMDDDGNMHVHCGIEDEEDGIFYVDGDVCDEQVEFTHWCLMPEFPK